MKRTALFIGIALASLAIAAEAQQYEIHPYAGGFFPGKFADVIEVDREGIYGAKGGMFLTRHIEAEAQFGYINNLSFKNTLTRKRAYIWEGAAIYNIGSRRKLYGTFGIGQVTTTVSEDARTLFTPSILMSDHFLSLSYGGGFKVL